LNSSLTELSNLELKKNILWFKDDKARDYLLEFIMSQTALKNLRLEDNNLSDETKQTLESWNAQNSSPCKIYYATRVSRHNKKGRK